MNVTCSDEVYFHTQRCDFACPPGNYSITEISGARPYIYGGEIPFYDPSPITTSNFTCRENFNIAMIYLDGIARFLAQTIFKSNETFQGSPNSDALNYTITFTPEKQYEYITPIFYVGIAITSFYIISCLGSLTVYRLVQR